MSDIIEACKIIDWGQIASHGGEACFHVEDGKFCLRAHRWPGHEYFHRPVSLGQLIGGICAENSRLRATDAPADWITKQRGDLKTCPFCGTAAIEQGREAESDTGMQWRIQCGNPFCELVCQTHVFAALPDAERAWQEREAITEADNSRIRAALAPILARLEMPAGGFSRTQDVMIQASELVVLQAALAGEVE